MASHLPISTTSTWEVNAHKPEDLVAAAIASFAPESTTSEKRARDLKSFFKTFARESSGLHNYTTTLTTSLLHQGWRLLSETFFLGALNEIPIDWDLELWLKQKAYGVTKGSGGATKVWIYPYPHLNGTKTAEHIFRTMMHEGAHALLHKYSCQSKFCGDAVCMEEKRREVSLGKTCHGLTWQQLAKAIEEHSSRYCGKFMRLGREESALVEPAMLEVEGAIAALFGGVDPRK